MTLLSEGTDMETTSISRRGFLGALAAFSAVVAGGVKMPPSTSPLPALPEQDDLLASLADCRVRKWDMNICYLEPSYLDVEYVYSPIAAKSPLDDYVAAARKNMRPILVSENVALSGPRTISVRFM